MLEWSTHRSELNPTASFAGLMATEDGGWEGGTYASKGRLPHCAYLLFGSR